MITLVVHAWDIICGACMGEEEGNICGACMGYREVEEGHL